MPALPLRQIRYGADVRVQFRYGLCAGAAHQRRHERFQLRDGSARAVEIHKTVPVGEAVVLAVVVPDGRRPQTQDVLLQALLPKLAALGAGEIPEDAVAAPPFPDAGGGRVVAVRHKGARAPEILRGADDTAARRA